MMPQSALLKMGNNVSARAARLRHDRAGLGVWRDPATIAAHSPSSCACLANMVATTRWAIVP